ncbi:MAG: MarR family transcriptional regulator [Burkholderiales bacterium]|nr:MAG: MarR family transcriptional regulator [Burkholderiales bacterium]
MPKKKPDELPDELFLIEVQDPLSGVTVPALRADRSPAMLLSFAANHFTDAASRHFKEAFDLGAVDWRLLFLFAREPGGTAAMAARTIGIDKGAVSRSLQRLEAEGLVVAGDLHANGRSRGWTLTAQGRRMHNRLLKIALARQKDVLAGFDVNEVEAFCAFLLRFQSNLAVLTGNR